MNVLITGGTGFIGGEICNKLLNKGHTVVLLTRNKEKIRADLQKTGISFVPYDYAEDSKLPLDLMGEIDGIINLAGEPIFTGRWTEEKKRRIFESRVNITRQLVECIASLKGKKPQVLVSASAVGYYGPRADEELKEEDQPGNDFLAQVCIKWEETALKATALGVRTVILRTGIVLDMGGGALAQMVPPFKYFVGGTIGSGKQWFSWIHREDMTNLYVIALEDDRLSGPVNATSPNPVKMSEVSVAMGKVLHRPSWFPIPPFLAKIIMGESAQVVVNGQKVIPEKLLRLKFPYKYPDILKALQDSLS